MEMVLYACMAPNLNFTKFNYLQELERGVVVEGLDRVLPIYEKNSWSPKF
jgi:hypothetical protein